MQKAGELENDAGFPKHIEGLATVYFALVIIIVVHVVKYQSVLINTCRRQESLRMVQGSPKHTCSQLNCSCYSYPSKPR